jgi:hypothetical protein
MPEAPFRTLNSTVSSDVIANSVSIPVGGLTIGGVVVNATAGDLNGSSTALQTVATDGITITGDGTVGNPLVAAGGGGATIGNPVTGATPNTILYSDSGGLLSNTSNLTWDSGNSRLGVGTTNPNSAIHIVENTLNAILTVESTDATAGYNTAPDIDFKSAKSVSNDYLGSLRFWGRNSAGSVQQYGNLTARIDDPNSANVAGSMFFSIYHQGSPRTFIFMEGHGTGDGALSFNYNAKNLNTQILNQATGDGGPGGYGFYHKASTGFIGMGTNNPQSMLHLVGADDNIPEVRVQRSGDSGQYLFIQNEDANGAYLGSMSREANKKYLKVQSLHDESGSPAGSNGIRWETGPASSPVLKMELIHDSDSLRIRTGETQIDGVTTIGPNGSPALTIDSGASSVYTDIGKSISLASYGPFFTAAEERHIGSTTVLIPGNFMGTQAPTNAYLIKCVNDPSQPGSMDLDMNSLNSGQRVVVFNDDPVQTLTLSASFYGGNGGIQGPVTMQPKQVADIYIDPSSSVGNNLMLVMSLS